MKLLRDFPSRPCMFQGRWTRSSTVQVQADAIFIRRRSQNLLKPPGIGPFRPFGGEELSLLLIPMHLHGRAIDIVERPGRRADEKSALAVDSYFRDHLFGHVSVPPGQLLDVGVADHPSQPEQRPIGSCPFSRALQHPAGQATRAAGSGDTNVEQKERVAERATDHGDAGAWFGSGLHA